MAETEKALAGGNRYQGLARILGRMGQGRSRSLAMAQYIRREVDMPASGTGKPPGGRASDLEECGNWLKFRDYYTVEELRLVAANFCQQHLLCPVCAIRRAAKYLAAYMQKIDYVRSQRPDATLVFYSYTIRNRRDLAGAVGHLLDCRKRLHQKRRNALRGASSCEFAKLSGGVEAVEVKRGAGSGWWHPHLHGVGLAESVPDRQALADEWHAITGDSHQVDVRPIGDGVKDLCEVFKYALKFSALSVEDNWNAFEELFGRRLLFSWGDLFGVQVPDDLTDGLLADELPFIELFFRYCEDGAYALVRAGASNHDHDHQQMKESIDA